MNVILQYLSGLTFNQLVIVFVLALVAVLILLAAICGVIIAIGFMLDKMGIKSISLK